MDVADVVFADLVAQLANRLEKRQALNVADRATNLDEHNVDGLGLRDTQDASLDLVGDMRNDLHRGAEVLATALAANHAVVDRAGRGVREARRVLVDKALVVAEVEVGLGTVLGDEHLAMLERAHRAGIDVDVRVELDDRDAHPAVLQNPSERSGGDAFAERGDDTAGDKHVPGLGLRHLDPPSSSMSILGRVSDGRPQSRQRTRPNTRAGKPEAPTIGGTPTIKSAPTAGSRSSPTRPSTCQRPAGNVR